MTVSQKTKRLEKCGVQINDNYGDVAVTEPHFKSHMRLLFFLALNGLDGPYTHNYSICNIFIQYVSEGANIFRHAGRKCTGRMIL